MLERPAHAIKDIYKLYVLYQLIVTQSADVERGFSLLNDALGLRRLSSHTQTLDAGLRIKQELPCNPTEQDLEWIGLKPVESSDAMNSGPNVCRSIYVDQSKPNRAHLLFQKLHVALSMEKDVLWTDVLGKEFEQYDSVDPGSDVEVDEPELWNIASMSLYTCLQ